MTLLASVAIGLALMVVVVGVVLVRAIVTGKMWFLGLDPVRSDQPLLFWYCFGMSLLPLLGGLFGVFILLSALVGEAQ